MYRYLVDAQFLDRSTSSVLFEAITFNDQLSVFGKWRLDLRRGSGGAFQGIYSISEVTGIAFFGAASGWPRVASDLALLVLCLMSMGFMLGDMLPSLRALLLVRIFLPASTWNK